jgi:hypothetical protein
MPRLPSVVGIAAFFSLPVHNRRDEGRIVRGVVEAPAHHDRILILGAMGGWVQIRVVDIEHRTVPGADDRFATRRRDDFIRDQLLYAQALGVPGGPTSQFWFVASEVCQTPMPSEKNNVLDAEGSKIILPFDIYDSFVQASQDMSFAARVMGYAAEPK